MTLTELKSLPKEEFLKMPETTEELYENIQKSKSGWIKVERDYDGAGCYGMTEAFGEGISCQVSSPNHWYITSVIQRIDWENHKFETMNSTYNFEFKSKEDLEKERDSFNDYIIEDLKIYES